MVTARTTLQQDSGKKSATKLEWTEGGFHMNCPYCGSPMEDGIVLGRTGVGLPWLPRGKDDNSFSVLRPIE